jgi:hypothetical protein
MGLDKVFHSTDSAEVIHTSNGHPNKESERKKNKERVKQRDKSAIDIPPKWGVFSLINHDSQLLITWPPILHVYCMI